MNDLSIPPITTGAIAAGETALPAFLQNREAALVVAHPGHELRLHGWLSLAHPCIYVLTDGSGHSGQSRLEATTRLLRTVGAEPGCIYGHFTDAEFYATLLNQDVALLINLADELATDLVRRRITYVVGDAIEGYNPTHDVCRLLINAAVEVASHAGGEQIANYEFAVVGHSDVTEPHPIKLRLDDQAYSNKIAAAQVYSAWMADVTVMLNEAEAESFRNEYLCATTSQGDSSGEDTEPPFYEQHGEKQVAAGYYKQVLRYRQHILPIAKGLRDYVERKRS